MAFTQRWSSDVAAFRQFAFVLDGEVVVSDDPDEGWAAGPPVLEPKALSEQHRS